MTTDVNLTSQIQVFSNAEVTTDVNWVIEDAKVTPGFIYLFIYFKFFLIW